MFQIARAIKKYKIVHTGANIQSGGLKNGLFNREYQGSLNLIVKIPPVKDAVNVTTVSYTHLTLPTIRSV